MHEVPDFSKIKREAVSAHMSMIQRVRKKGALSSIKSEKKEVEKQASKEPPSLYEVGDEVLVQVENKKSNKVKGKGVTVPRCYTGKVVGCNTKINKYKVSTVVDSKELIQWYSVSKITSVTRAQEKIRQKNTDCEYCSINLARVYRCIVQTLLTVVVHGFQLCFTFENHYAYQIELQYVPQLLLMMMFPIITNKAVAGKVKAKDATKATSAQGSYMCIFQYGLS